MEIKFVIAGETPGLKSEGYKPEEDYTELKNYAEALIKAINDKELDVGVGVEEAYYEVYVLNEAGLSGEE